MSEQQAALIWCPFPDAETAREIAGQLLEARLIACANLLPQMEAVFEWEGERSSAIECAALFKTTATRLEQAIQRLGELHPYDTPAICGWNCDATHPQTQRWMAGVIGADAAADRTSS